MINLITATIGIPAFNESNNILNLLESIKKQRQDNFRLDKIIVLSDGSDDQMEQIVINYSKKNPKVQLIADKLHKGKNERLMELYKLNTSDVVINLDADIILGHKNTLEKLIAPIKQGKACVVSGNMQPIISETFFEKLINKWFVIWYDIRKNLNKGDNIHNSLSSISAVEKNFSKSISIPKNIYSCGQFNYCLLKVKNNKFYFEKSALIYFRLPNNIYDYIKQTRRNEGEELRLSNMFGKKISEYYSIPIKLKISVLLNHFFKNPFYTLCDLFVFYFFSVFINNKKNQKRNGLWDTINSTKSGLNITI